MTPITIANLDYVRELVERGSAVVLGHEKGYLVEARLAPMAARDGFTSVNDFVAHLRRTPSGPVHLQVVEAMTTNETTFFRDLHPFEALSKHAIPKLVEARARQRSLSVWSAASSSGQEAYSIAMLLESQFPQLNHWDTRILATDLSSDMVSRAAAGRYTQLEVNRGLPAILLVKHFHKVGIDWRISDALRSRVSCDQFNLADDDWSRVPRMDVIFLRNVLIYFDTTTRKAILARVRQVLRSDGYLFLGEAETTHYVDTAFERVDFGRAACYQLRRETPARAANTTGTRESETSARAIPATR